MKSMIRGLLLVFVMLGSVAYAVEPINTLEKSGFFGYKSSGVAIRGYDTVAYFTQGKPVDGNDAFVTSWNGATWRFSSQEHLDLFVADPDKYAPQYGGYCAYGVAIGSLVKIEPDFWAIVDGKLYLNYDKKYQRYWDEDIAGHIKSADEQIDGLLAE